MKITELYGKCDNYDVVFHQNERGLWETTVPADFEDGKYIAEFWAHDITGLIIYWTGILYMYDGKVIFIELAEDPYRVIIGGYDKPTQNLCGLITRRLTMGRILPEFILGEKKYVWFKVTSKIEQKVVLKTATWSLTDGNDVLDHGDCEIDGDTIKVLLCPTHKGCFMLNVEYHIPPEIKKTGVSIIVS